MDDKIKIVLADDEVLFQKGIAFILSREDTFEIVQEVNDGEQLLHYLDSASELPDIILMDLKMPNLNGVEATRFIGNKFPSIRIIALTSYNTPSFIANMIHLGAVSYLVKNTTPAEMIQTINEVFDKGFYYNQEVLKVIQEGIAEDKTKRKRSLFEEDEGITDREREVLELICRQFSTSEIADKLCISKRTVEGHRNSLMVKTNTKNIAGLVVYSLQNRIVDLNSLMF